MWGPDPRWDLRLECLGLLTEKRPFPSFGFPRMLLGLGFGVEGSGFRVEENVTPGLGCRALHGRPSF